MQSGPIGSLSLLFYSFHCLDYSLFIADLFFPISPYVKLLLLLQKSDFLVSLRARYLFHLIHLHRTPLCRSLVDFWLQGQTSILFQDG